MHRIIELLFFIKANFMKYLRQSDIIFKGFAESS